jgi:RNA polymerase sigma-70 factor (ECF subfamily)
MKSFFETTIWPLKSKLYRMAYLWVKDRDIAQDLLQAVFEKALKNDDKLRELSNPVGWMVSTLKNESLQYHRSEKKFEPLGDREFPGENYESDEPREEVKRVFLFLSSLPEKQQEVFHLREVEGLTYEEISDYLEISLDQVKVNLHRARKSLREHLTRIGNER